MNGQESSPQPEERNGTSAAIFTVVVLVLALAAIFFFIATNRGGETFRAEEGSAEEQPVNEDNGTTADDGNGMSPDTILPSGEFEAGSEADLQVE